MGRTATVLLRAVSCLAVAAGLAITTIPPAFAQEAAAQTVAAPAEAVRGLPAWDITNSDFPADPDITFGRLPNGMRYALMRNPISPEDDPSP